MINAKIAHTEKKMATPFIFRHERSELWEMSRKV